MTKMIFRGTALALALVAVQATPALAKDKAAAAEKPGEKLGEKITPFLAKAQDANNKKDYTSALAELDKAEPLAATPYEKFVTAQFRAIAGQGLNNQALVKTAAAAAADSGYTGQGVMNMALFSGQLEYQARDYASAIRHLKLAQTLGNTDPNVALYIGDCYLKNKQTSEGLAYFEKIYTDDVAAKRVTSREILDISAQAALDAHMSAETMTWLSRRVALYPAKDTWHDLLAIYRDEHNALSPQAVLDLYRLMGAANAFKSPSEIAEYAEYANDKRGLPGEAKAAIDGGIAAGIIKTLSKGLSDLQASINKRVGEDRASVTALTNRPVSAPNGIVARGNADALFGYKEYAKAIDYYKLARTTGGVDARIINMGLGESYAMSGDKANATAALGAVTGESADIAGFWKLYVNQVK